MVDNHRIPIKYRQHVTIKQFPTNDNLTMSTADYDLQDFKSFESFYADQNFPFPMFDG